MKRKVLNFAAISLIILILLTTLLAWLGWSAYKKHPFFSHLRAPEKPIEEVIIRSYGNVPNYLLQAAKSSIEDKIGVLVIIEPSRAEFSEQSSYSNQDRKQFDADKIWDSERAFASSTSTKRLIMIVDVDLYTELQPERQFVFSRSSPNVSVILISTYRLQKLSDTNEKVAPPELASSRIQKLALQTLGVSVFLEGFSTRSTEDKSCVMYRGRILTELDQQGDDFCKKNKEKLNKYFLLSTEKI